MYAVWCERNRPLCKCNIITFYSVFFTLLSVVCHDMVTMHFACVTGGIIWETFLSWSWFSVIKMGFVLSRFRKVRLRNYMISLSLNLKLYQGYILWVIDWAMFICSICLMSCRNIKGLRNARVCAFYVCIYPKTFYLVVTAICRCIVNVFSQYDWVYCLIAMLSYF